MSPPRTRIPHLVFSSTACTLLPFLLLLQLSTCATTLSTVPLSAPVPTLSDSPSYTSDTLFQAAVLNSTNTYRAAHNATALAWNETLAAYAEEHAQGCVWGHSNTPNGENLAKAYPCPTTAIDAWAAEQIHYDRSHPSFDKGTGHFTQLVWKETKTVGCARAQCRDASSGNSDGDGGGTGTGGPGWWYLVCEYWPPGNVEGGFAANVQFVGGKGGGGGYVLGEAVGAGVGVVGGFWVAAVVVMVVFVTGMR
ncbi:hypothetical protein LTR28_010856 [Elasticomyces elasticus]|nr:hypothetical protein LTR28_010856 [Elasticomyces elasticus]